MAKKLLFCQYIEKTLA